MTPPRLHLSKSRYLAGLQCEKHLWLRGHRPELASEPTASQQAIFDTGNDVGLAAHRLFPGGVLVAEGPERLSDALARTRALLDDASVPAIFEAAFEHRGVVIRVDALERLGSAGWGLREVKAATSVKDEYRSDVAVQKFVLEGCGLRVPSAELVHVCREYVRGEGEIDWRRLFTRADLTAEADAMLREVGSGVAGMHALLARTTEPGVEPGPHCFVPYDCAFWEHCSAGKPADWVFHLPRLQAKGFERFRAEGIERIPEIPEEMQITEIQRRIREVLRSGRTWVSPDLGAALASLEPRVWHLDFEAMMPAIPIYPGTRPYDALPFQWSLHADTGEGAVVHREFLADGREDPRRALAESLLEALAGDRAPIAVYSSYEKRTLRELAAHLPDLAGGLAGLVERLVDLLPLVRNHVYHPAFRGSFSLKAVAPALVPGFGYADLDGVAGGGEAAAVFPRIARGELDASQEAAVRRALLAYCKRDTEALLGVRRALGTLSGGAPAAAHSRGRVG